ncbi:GHKL domain-containing protein [Lactobacillus johnsonii]|uniref:GHKL domain-containing protein n=1 Tax=Lactobacillus johnsonii TaxID=33959 RepID=UPI000207BE4A|nr:GHKL domain-containing protein [Lactobacillus johnsonii]AEB92911.1 lactacin F two-component system histidine kinase [Lactobacillus johnsonii DPC 6026]
MTSFLNVVLVITFYQTGPDGLFYFSKVFNLILQSAEKLNTYTKTNLKSDAFKKYKDVNHVNIRSLKSIIISKLTEMYNLEISYNFECDEVINKIPPHINEIDLVRIIGITCDNAIEESRELIRKGEDAQIEIMIYSTEETLEYEIQNKKRNLAISTKKIQQKGFSTKKEHSGLGLSTIRKITETYENMSITYDISNDYFDFYLVMDREV